MSPGQLPGRSGGSGRSLAGSLKLGGHLGGTEAPTMLGGIINIGIRSKARSAFRNVLLKELAADPAALNSWKHLLSAGGGQAERTARTLKGEWNWMVREMMLPEFIHASGAPRVPDDLDAFFDRYIDVIMSSMDGLSRDRRGD